jgi:hypothetical protein
MISWCLMNQDQEQEQEGAHGFGGAKCVFVLCESEINERGCKKWLSK